MASNYTANYELPLWAADDAFLRTEFNDAHEKIDAALADASAGVITGSYMGDGTSERVIALPFMPKLVVVSGYAGSSTSPYQLLTFVTPNFTHTILPGGINARVDYIQMVENGICIKTNQYHNVSGYPEYYVAIR